MTASTPCSAIPKRARSFCLGRWAAGRDQTYELVLIDPPYRIATKLIDSLNTYLPKVLSEDATVVTESSPKGPLLLDLPLRVEKSYGDTVVTIYGLSESEHVDG